MSDPIALQANGLTLSYSGASPVIKDMDLSIPKGRFTALLGPNGSGKSTLLKGFGRILTAQSGRVILEGEDIAALPAKALARRISMLAQNAQAPEGLTVSDLVRQGRYPHRSVLGGWTAEDGNSVSHALELTGLTNMQSKRLDTLSGGQRQRAWIAMTLAQEGEVMLLDEPTTFLDLAHQIDILALVRGLMERRGATVVAVLHDINQAARTADHVVLLKDGQVAAEGAAKEVLNAENVLNVFGVPVTVIPDPETGAPLIIPRAATSQPSNSDNA